MPPPFLDFRLPRHSHDGRRDHAELLTSPLHSLYVRLSEPIQLHIRLLLLHENSPESLHCRILLLHFHLYFLRVLGEHVLVHLRLLVELFDAVPTLVGELGDGRNVGDVPHVLDAGRTHKELAHVVRIPCEIVHFLPRLKFSAAACTGTRLEVHGHGVDMPVQSVAAWTGQTTLLVSLTFHGSPTFENIICHGEAKISESLLKCYTQAV